jgi:hypothetical protein
MLQRDAGLRGKEGSKGRAVAAFKAKGEKDKGGKEGVRGWGPGWRHNGVARGGTNLKEQRGRLSSGQRTCHNSGGACTHGAGVGRGSDTGWGRGGWQVGRSREVGPNG